MSAKTVAFILEIERGSDGRFLADCKEHPGCLEYGDTEAEAIANCLTTLAGVVLDDVVDP